MKAFLGAMGTILMVLFMLLSTESYAQEGNKEASMCETKSATEPGNELEILRGKLAESEARYHTLTLALDKASWAGTVINSLDGLTIDANQAYLDMLGYTLEEIKSITYQQLTPEKWHAMEQGLFENQVMKRGLSEVYEKEYIRKDGSIFPIRIQAWLISDEGGKPWRLFGIVRDISAEKKQ